MRKLILMTMFALTTLFTVRGETAKVGDYTWSYQVVSGGAKIGSIYNNSCAVSPKPTGDFAIPSTLDGYPVTSIGSYAFEGCSGLTSVTIPSSVTSIALYAFEGCSGLTSVTIPEGVTSIEMYAFYECSGLTSVTISSSVTSIGSYAFRGCSGMTAFIVDSKNPNYQSVNGLLLTKDGKELIAGVNGDVVISNGVTSIGDYAFYGCSELTSVTIPEGLTSIGSYAFYWCSELTSVTIPEGVTSIGWYAFDGCSGLTSVTIPSSVKDIKAYAFTQCNSLKVVKFDGKKPTVGGRSVFENTPADMIIRVGSDYSLGWYYSFAYERMRRWLGKLVVYDNETKPLPWKTQDVEASLDMINAYLELFDSIGLSPTDAQKLDLVWWYQDLVDDCPEYLKAMPGFLTSVGAKLTSDEKDVMARWAGSIVSRQIGAGTVHDEPDVQKNNIVTVISTNVVVHYVLNSVQPDIAVPISDDIGIVNVLSEVKGGNVAIPESWKDNYPEFSQRFGADFTQALTKPSNKFDAAKNAMYVWQDYVAGTDPTDENDVFRASVTMVDGKPVISWTPELSDEEAAKREYKTFGKVSLQDPVEQWVEVAPGQEANYNFFKVTVEMKP